MLLIFVIFIILKIYMHILYTIETMTLYI